MNTQQPENQPPLPLPILCPELQVFLGPEESDGSPTYTIFDPVKDKYYKISWIEALILKNLSKEVTIDDLIAKVNAKSTIGITKEEIEHFLVEAKKMGLLIFKGEELEREHEPESGLSFLQLFRKMFYVRVPLFHPDQFLERTLKYVRFLGSTPFLILFGLIAFLGFCMLLIKFDLFINTFTYFYHPKGIAAYVVAIILLKCVHELSHAYVAKHYGVEVSSMGIVFIIMWPVMFTDVTHSWAIKERKKRLAITFAGVISELIIAGISTVLWHFSSPGILQSIFFVLASVTWISSLLINTNPAMRFDGYYALSDLVGVDNLQNRAFATTRWLFRRWFIGLELVNPEPRWSMRKIYWLAVYSVFTWVYRIFVYMGIGLFFYWTFTKSIGVFIAATALFQFFVAPILGEIQVLWKLKKGIQKRVRLRMTLCVLFLVAFWFVFPTPSWSRFPAVVTSQFHQLVYSHQAGQVIELNTKLGDFVNQGDVLLKIESLDLDYEVAKREKEKAITLTEIDIATTHEEEESKSLIPEKRATLAKIEAELAGFYELKNQNTIYSHVTGQVYDWDDWVLAGEYIDANKLIGRIANLDTMRIYAFAPESDIQSIELGNTVSFQFNRTGEHIDGKIVHISPVRLQFLLHPQLGSIYGGELPVVATEDDRLAMLETYYQVEIELEKTEQKFKVGETGQLHASLGWKSRFVEWVKWAITIFWRESAF